MTILLGDRICNEINVLTSNFILLGYQLLDEMGCHHTRLFHGVRAIWTINSMNLEFKTLISFQILTPNNIDAMQSSSKVPSSLKTLVNNQCRSADITGVPLDCSYSGLDHYHVMTLIGGELVM